MSEYRSKVSSKGQIVVPVEVRKAKNIEEGDDVKFIIDDNGNIKLEIIKKESILDLYGSLKPNVPDLREFSEIRKEAHEIKMREHK